MKLASFLTSAVLVLAGIAHATTHVITFGTTGFTYTPSQLNVNVGDTILWQGSFAEHPLSTTSVPAGAQTISHNATGTTLTYIVTKEGTYNYQCDFHSSFGMTGSFTAAAAGVAVTQPVAASLSSNPNPAAFSTMIHYVLKHADHVTISLYDASGVLVKQVLDEEQSEGMHMVTLDTKQIASGSYSYVLSTPSGVLRKQMIVVR